MGTVRDFVRFLVLGLPVERERMTPIRCGNIAIRNGCYVTADDLENERHHLATAGFARKPRSKRIFAGKAKRQ